jgi:DNA-binding response OmpR family regulator
MKKVLVVDDEAVLAETVAMFLDKKKFRIACCHSVPEAKEIIKDLRPDIVISDLVMPEMDGLDLLNWIRDNNYSCIFVLMTVKSSVFPPLHRADRKPDIFISKPFNAEELNKALKLAVSLSAGAKGKEAGRVH